MGATEPDTSEGQVGGPAADAEADRQRSARNALKLTAALGVTLTISFFVRVLLPRSLGPERFGDYSFAEAFATTVFVALSLGLDQYVYREVARRPEHATDFFGGTLVLRLLLSVALTGGMALFLDATGRGADVRLLVWLFAGTQLLVTVNTTFGSMLHARASVDGLSLSNVAGKVVWAAGVVAAAAARAPPWAFVLPSLASEALRAAVLFALVRRHLGLRLRVNVPEVRAVLFASAPFYFNAVVVALMSKLDVSILALRAPSSEVGFYGVAVTVSAIALLATPVLGSVLFPLMSRAAARSDAEFDDLMRRTVELTIAGSVPAAVGMSLAAEPMVRLLFGAAYAPAAQAVSIFSPMLILTYATIVWGMSLNVLGRGWSTALATLGGVAVDAVLNLTLLPTAMRWFGGPGAGGSACSAFMVVSEATVVVLLLRALGPRAFDRSVLSRAIRTAVAAAAAVATDVALGRLGPAPRLAAAGTVYLVVAVAVGALGRKDVEAARALIGRRKRGGEVT